MYAGKLENHYKEKWVKKFLKTSDPGPLALLIEERIKWPVNTGPVIPFNSDEEAVDIISEMIVAFPELHNKVQLATGLVLYKLLNNQLDQTSNMMFGVFTLIKNNNFTNCALLVFEWINKNNQYLKADNKQGTELYNYALFTFGTIQVSPDANMEQYWLALWRDAKPQFWAAAFSGLRKQNRKLSIEELPLLISRNTERTGAHLVAMMEDENCWPLLQKTLNVGLDTDKEYCGLALNALLSKLDKPKQLKLLGQLQTYAHNTSS